MQKRWELRRQVRHGTGRGTTFSSPSRIAYDLGTGLDGFYILLPYSFSGGEHNRVNGQTVTVGGRQWKAVSWHYPDGKQFSSGTDSIESHIVHCRGFFLARGAVNARV